MREVVAICDHFLLLGMAKLPHKVHRKTRPIALDLFVKAFGWYAIKLRQISIEDDSLLSNNKDAMFNLGFACAVAQTQPPGVYVAMNGKIFAWDNVQKNKAAGVFQPL